jgi:hypothetical protein
LEGPLGVGTTFEQVLRLLGRRIVTAFEVTAYEPNRRIQIGRFPGRWRSAVGRRTFEPTPGGTRVAFAAEGKSGLFFNLLEPLVTVGAKRAARRDLANLKNVLGAEG